MIVSREVGTYEVLLVSHYLFGSGNQIGFVYLYDPAGAYLGYAGIITNGSALPANTQSPLGDLAVYFHETELVPILDTLRNEKPVFVQFDPVLKWGSIGTGKVPVGEQEPAAP